MGLGGLELPTKLLLAASEQGNLLAAEDDLEKVRLICGTECKEYVEVIDALSPPGAAAGAGRTAPCSASSPRGRASRA